MALQPFRVNMDQDTLFFLIDFFNTLVPQEDEAASSGGTAGDPGRGGGGAVGQAQNADSQNCIRYSSGMQAIEIRCPPPPGPEGGAAEVFEDAVSSLPVIKEEGAAATPRSKSSTPGPAPAAGGGGGAANIYFRSFEFSPSVPIRIDYVGKYVDLTQGVLTGILAGLAQLNCSELTLPQLHLKVELHNMFFSPD